MRRRLVGTALALACAAPCAAAPTVVPGWPVPAAPGPVLQGPGGGPVVVNQGLLEAFRYTVTAYRVDGRRRWVNARTADCGNCDEGPQPARRQADGTFGPIGVIGDDYWAVDAAGRRVPGCSGAVLPDGTCIATRFRIGPGPGFSTVNSLVARRAGADLWELVEPGLNWIPEGDVGPVVVRDGGGTAYTAYGQFTPGARHVAVDSATGGLRARTPGDVDFVAATADAGLAGGGGAPVAIGPDGAGRWSAALTSPSLLPENVIVDRARGRAHIGQRISRRWRTTALAAGTGRVLWRSPAGRSVRPLSLATGGLLLAAVEQGATRSLQALGPDGRPRWTFRTSGTVIGARELGDRTVVVSTESLATVGRGPLWRIDPLRRR